MRFWSYLLFLPTLLQEAEWELSSCSVISLAISFNLVLVLELHFCQGVPVITPHLWCVLPVFYFSG
jgi:hypothetical protein